LTSRHQATRLRDNLSAQLSALQSRLDSPTSTAQAFLPQLETDWRHLGTTSSPFRSRIEMREGLCHERFISTAHILQDLDANHHEYK
jgi:hypothetical protein